MSKSEGLSFTQLHPGRDVSATEISRLVTRLTKTGSPRPLVFELCATPEAARYFVGRHREDTGAVRLLLSTQLPGAVLERGQRPSAPDSILRLSLHQTLPLATGAEQASLYSLHAAFQSVQKDESIALQVVVGGGRGPQRTPTKVADPAQTLLGNLLHGQQPAPADARKRIADHRAAPRLDVTIRLGVTAGHPARRRQLLKQVIGAIKIMESPGTRLDVTRESGKGWTAGAPGWAPLTLTGDQLIPFLAWPLKDLALPGQPDAHPLLLAPPAKLSKEGAEFASTAMPGRANPVRLSLAARSQHVAITGGTGSGKSTVLSHLILDDIVNKRAALLIDPKRQLVDHILERAPKDSAGRIVIIDAAAESPVGLNPLDVGDRDPDIVVDGILAVFKEVFADGWGPRTEDLLHAGLLSLARSGRERGTPHTLLDLPRLLSDDGFRRSVIGHVKDDATLASFWAVFDGLSPAHRASIIAAPMNKLRKYVLRKNVAAVLGQAEPRFRLRDVFRQQKVVLVPLNDALLGPGAAQLLGGLVVAEAWLATMERAAETDPLDRPGAIYIDEVQRYLHLPTSIEDALATSRSYGVAWVLALQGRAQVPKSFAQALELNARNKLTFAASPTDARELARSSSKLTVEDFQALRPYELYIDLVSGGAPAGWFSARSLPPAKPLGHDEVIRRINAERYGAREQTEPDQVASQPGPTDLPLTNQRRRRS